MNTPALLLTVFGSLLGIGGFFGAYLSIKRVQSDTKKYDFSQKLIPLVIAVILFLLSWYCWAELRNDLDNKLIYTKQINHLVLSQNKIVKLSIPLRAKSSLLLDIKPVNNSGEQKQALSYVLEVKDQQGTTIFSQSRSHRLFQAGNKSPQSLSSDASAPHWLDLPAIHLSPNGDYFTLFLSDIDVKNTDLNVTVSKQ
ncbi:hypothetical protein [uncultured Pseudoteredinibacter sp.]|uniref:hypothetical protein n=1 Tax=uncultured Pseudoteredinibacter sp. TaxID=1641701 RepID=UPI002611A8EF|nr:hypothetical protein [uncultured Pseudoteredinibacter sp.]